MKVDLSCPLELRSYELISDDAGNTRASIRLYNLTNRRIAAFEAVAHWRDSRTGFSLAAPFSADRLRAEPRAFFGISLSTSAQPRPDHVELVFSRIRFEDGEREWRTGGGTVVNIEEMRILSGQEQNLLFASAGEDAVRFAGREGEIWHCVCGRDNMVSEEKCWRCGRLQAEVFPGLTQAELLRGNPQATVELPLDDMPLEERRHRLEIQAQRRPSPFRRRLNMLLRAVSGIATLGLLAGLALSLL